MDGQKTVISTSAKRRNTSKGLHYTQQVVYKVPIGKSKGKQLFASRTRHEIINK